MTEQKYAWNFRKRTATETSRTIHKVEKHYARIVQTKCGCKIRIQEQDIETSLEYIPDDDKCYHCF